MVVLIICVDALISAVTFLYKRDTEAREAVEEYEELNTVIELVWFVNTTGLLFTFKLPVTVTDPVNSWVSVSWLPNIFDPEL